MLSPQPVVIDFEGYRLTNQPFILKELSVRGVDCHDTILSRPPHSSNILNTKAPKSYNWVTKNLHGLTWDSGNCDYSSVFYFFLSLKLRFSNILVYAKGREKCEYLTSFFPHSIDLDTLSWPKSSEFNKTDGFICLNHQISTTGTTAQERKLACSSIGSPIANNNNNNNNTSKNNLVSIAADQMIKDNQRLVLSSNLTISVSTIQNATTSNHLNNCSIDFVKEEYRKIGDHKLLRKTVSKISPAEYFQLKSSANSIDSFLQFIVKKNVKPTSAELDEGAENPTHHHHLIPSYYPASMIVYYPKRLRKNSNHEKIFWKLPIYLHMEKERNVNTE